MIKTRKSKEKHWTKRLNILISKEQYTFLASLEEGIGYHIRSMIDAYISTYDEKLIGSKKFFPVCSKRYNPSRWIKGIGNIKKKPDDLVSYIESHLKYVREPIPDYVKLFVWKRDEGMCVICGSDEKLEFDHIIPVSKGGSNTAHNVQLLCAKHNHDKRDGIVIEPKRPVHQGTPAFNFMLAEPATMDI